MRSIAFYMSAACWMQTTLAAASLVIVNSPVPGVVLAAADTSAAGSSVTLDRTILGEARPLNYEAWRPFAVVLTNQSAEHIAAIALRWTATDKAGSVTQHVLSRSLFDRSQQILPGHSVLVGPSWLLSAPVTGNSEALPLADSSLQRLQSADTVTVALDGIVFSSGQFVGPDTEHELEAFQATGDARNVDATVMEMQAAGKTVAAIVEWLQSISTQAVPAGAARIRAARMLLRVYSNNGEEALIKAAQRQLDQPFIAVRR
jgi:hypothetical protein